MNSLEWRLIYNEYEQPRMEINISTCRINWKLNSSTTGIYLHIYYIYITEIVQGQFSCDVVAITIVNPHAPIM